MEAESYPERKETNSGDTPIFRFYDFWDNKYLFSTNEKFRLNPIGSMYGIFTYIWLIFLVNVGKYTSPMDPMGMR